VISQVICILDGISSSAMDVKYTFRIQAPSGTSLDVGVKTEDDLKQWVDAIRNCAQRSSVCITPRQPLPTLSQCNIDVEGMHTCACINAHLDLV